MKRFLGSFSKISRHANITIHSDFLASNSPCEDFSFLLSHKSNLLAGILDGHSGTKCASILQQQLPKYSSFFLNNYNDPAHAMSLAFQALDHHILNGAFPISNNLDIDSIRQNLQPLFSGSCAIVSFIQLLENETHVYVATTGDSRAVLGLNNPGTSEWSAIPLSTDQTAKNLSEVIRIESEHPNENVIRNGRVLGGLMPTRAFGDAYYKLPIDDLKVIESVYDMMSYTEVPYKTPPYVTAKPVVTKYVIPNTNTNAFVVIGSDGLYDFLSSEECVEIVAGYLRNKRGIWNYKDSDNIATCLIRNSLGPSDERVEQMLNLEKRKRRLYRDDMTVQVLLINKRQDNFQAQENSNMQEIGQIPQVEIPTTLEKKLEYASWLRFLN